MLKGLDKVVLAWNWEEENMDLLIEENNKFELELEWENKDANLLIEEDDINSFIWDSEVDEFSNDNAIEEVENDLVDEFIKPDWIYDEIEEKLEDVLYEMEDNDFSVKEDELEEENNNE
jgi:DNA polymerase I-like protein with 3'-5' exonuclease and polymerase domains